MKEHPILFSGAMVRAILEGRKTQTRRMLKWQPANDDKPLAVEMFNPTKVDKNGEEYPGQEVFGAYGDDWGLPCPYGQPGDRLWVRETWSTKKITPFIAIPIYAATGDKAPGHWKPSIHMPRKYSRIILEITSVRVERLQDIGEEDAFAEGVQIPAYKTDGGEIRGLIPLSGHKRIPKACTGREFYATLWDDINGAGSWDKNPWVWVVEFKRI